MATSEKELGFTRDAVKYSTDVERFVRRKLRDLAVEHAQQDGRTTVTEDDMRACVEKAFKQWHDERLASR